MFLESSFPLWFQRFLWRVSTKTDRSELRNVTRNITSQLSRIFYDLLCVMTNWFCNLKKVILDWKELQPIVTKQILPDSSTINSWLVTHVSRPTLPQVWGGGWLPIWLPPGVPNLSALINHTFGTHDSDEFTAPNLEKFPAASRRPKPSKLSRFWESLKGVAFGLQSSDWSPEPN